MIEKKLLILFFLFALVSTDVLAQLYIGPDTFVYNTNQVVFVAQEVELKETTSTFYLRKEGQLLQGTTGTSNNKGSGSLSAFQEGTVNNYAYNYWCSPVGGTLATAGNAAFGITQLGVPTTTRLTSPATILPMNNYDGASAVGALAIAPYWIWKFSVKDAYADWISVGSNTTIAAGEGFTMKGVSGSDATVVDGVTTNAGSNQRYDFRGKPNDGTITIPVAGDGTDAGSQFTLTGNPYPSAIDLNQFLLDPDNIGKTDGAAYYWESDKTVNSHLIAEYEGGYGTYVPVSLGVTGIYNSAVFYSFDGSGNYGSAVTPPPPGLSFERRFCPIGQGFMINGKQNGTVQMKNSYRVFVKEDSGTSQFEKKKYSKNLSKSAATFLPNIVSVSGFDYATVSKLPVPQIRFKTILNEKLVIPMVLGFESTATDAADFGMDARSINEDLDQEIYFDIQNKPYSIDVIAFDQDKKIPLGLRNTAAAHFKISIDEILNFPLTQDVFIHSIENNSYHNLKQSPFEVDLPAGHHTNQFEITFTATFTAKQSLSLDEKNTAFFEVQQNNTTQELTINNLNAIALKEISVFDISGKKLFSTTKLNATSKHSYPTSTWSDGVYIVKITTTENRIESKKIVVGNRK